MRDPGSAADEVVAAVLADLVSERHRGVVVDSPPGAGKSTLVVRAARELATTDRVMIIAQTNEQVDDLIERLAAADPRLRIGRLSATDYRPAPRIADLRSVQIAAKVADLEHPAVTIGTAAKWATVSDGSWPWAIVDEAYQMRSDALLRVAARFERALFVGDPGQLDPFSTVETGRWTGLTWDPMQSAVAVLLRHNPELPVHRLPVSWRLPPSAASVVSQAFYPDAPFVAGSQIGDRRLILASTAASASASVLDHALDTAAQTGWGSLTLPAKHTARTDAEAVAACAELAGRLIERKATAVCERETAPVTGRRIAIGTAHRDQAAAVRAALPAHAAEVTVDTANRLQGREYDVTIVLHPLSGRRDATAFHLEAGRLCVLTSRHRQACVVVARAGIAELLDAYPSREPVPLDMAIRFPDGWEAHHALLARLAR